MTPQLKLHFWDLSDFLGFNMVQPQPCFPPQPCPKRPQICFQTPFLGGDRSRIPKAAESFVAISIFGFVFFGISVTMKYSPSTCGSLATDFGTSPLLSQSQKKTFEILKDPSRAPKPQVFFFHKQKIRWFWVETPTKSTPHPSSEANGKSCHGEISLSFARKKRR